MIILLSITLTNINYRNKVLENKYIKERVLLFIDMDETEIVTVLGLDDGIIVHKVTIKCERCKKKMERQPEKDIASDEGALGRFMLKCPDCGHEISANVRNEVMAPDQPPPYL